MNNINFLFIFINSKEFLVKPTLSLLEASKYLGFHIPRFCYHELLSIAGNCRMCLVEIKNSPKPIASCALPLVHNMQVFLNTPLVIKARENILETLLINHPLDCPICDQGGECDLQDQTEKYGSDKSRFFFNKRKVEDKNLNSIIKTIMTRCIHCTRCVRFNTEILGTETLGLLNRGNLTEIGNYTTTMLLSEISGNIIDLCPVGALTSKSYSFKIRPWEIRSIESIDLTDSLGSNIYINFKDVTISRIIPKLNYNINNNLISDNARYFFDSLESQRLIKFYSINKYKYKSQSFLSYTIKKELLSICLQNKKILFLINEQLDLESITLIKFLSYKYQIKVRTFKTFNSELNFFISNFFNKINLLKNSMKTFFIISSNIKLESSILNSKLRIKFIKEDIQIYNILGTTSLNFFTNSVNINMQTFLKILEGKHSISLLLAKIINPFFIIGETLLKRGVSFSFIQLFFTTYFPSACFLNIYSKCNSVGIDFNNIKNLSTQDLKVNKILIAVNLKETLQLYKYCKKINKQIYWLNTHGCFYFSKISSTLIPILPSFNEDGIYINLEQRAQLAPKVFLQKFDSTFSLNFKQELKKLFLNPIVFLYYDFYKNIIKNPVLFNNLTSIFKTPIFFYKKKIFNYPIKFYIEDVYLFSKLTQFSKILASCSYNLRKVNINFCKQLFFN